MPPDVHKVLARNLRTLAAWSGESQRGAAEKSEGAATQKTFSNMMSETHSAKLKTIAGAANSFKVPPWVLLLNKFPESRERCSALVNLVRDYLHAESDGKEVIERLARALAERSGPQQKDDDPDPIEQAHQPVSEPS